MDDDPTSDFGSIINGVNENVDAIVSGHTHLAYNCSFQVDDWAGRAVTDRPVVSAGQYGMALNQLVFTVDSATGEVQAKTQALLTCAARRLRNGEPVSPNYPADPATQADRRRRGGQRRGAGRAASRQPRWSVLPRQARERHDGEPWRGVDAGQPGGGGPEVGHPQPGVRRGTDRVHEPGWSARTT